jgi:predicted ester cyclase
MSPEDGKALVRRRFEEFDRGNLSVFDEMFAGDYVLNFGTSEPLSLEQTKKLYEALYSTFSDLRHTIEDQIAEGDRIVTRWTARGTYRGDLGGTETTDKRIILTGINIYRIAGEKLVESHVSWDIHALMEQLGAAAPAPGFLRDLRRAAD